MHKFISNDELSDQLSYVKNTIKPAIDSTYPTSSNYNFAQGPLHNSAVSLQGALAALIDTTKSPLPTEQATASDMSIANFSKIINSSLPQNSVYQNAIMYAKSAQSAYTNASSKIKSSTNPLTPSDISLIKQNMPTAIITLVLAMLSIVLGTMDTTTPPTCSK
jgi:hypothetical protein